MRRRDLLTLLCGAAASSVLRPRAACAEPAGRVRHIGVLLNLAAEDQETETPGYMGVCERPKIPAILRISGCSSSTAVP
jgi:hypothetical protein